MFPIIQRVELSDTISVDKTDSAALSHLQRVDAFLSEGQWDEAVETLRRVMTEFGEKLIELPNHRAMVFSTLRYVDVRRYCQIRLSALPPEALELYRKRVDPQAERWYREGVARHSQQRWLDVVEQYFCSRFGDDALLALGDLALEQGDADLARDYWERILPPTPRGAFAIVPREFYEATRGAKGLPDEAARRLDQWYELDETHPLMCYRLRGEGPLSADDAASLVRFWKSQSYITTLTYPDTDLPKHDVYARLVLASLMEGDRPRATAELQEFTRMFPEATGRLAGRQGKLAALLAALLHAAADWQAPLESADWPTFAGAQTRNHVAPVSGAFDIRSPAWFRPLEKVALPDLRFASNYGYRFRRVAEDNRELLSYHPVVVHDVTGVDGPVLLYSTESQVFGLRLADGQPAWPTAPNRPPGEIFHDEARGTPPPRRQGFLGAPRFTLTAHGDRLFARLGSPITVNSGQRFRQEGDYLVCLNLAASGMEVWRAPREAGPESEEWNFEGSPVTDGANVYIGMRRGGVRSQAHVACFDADTGRLRWRRFVCGADTPGRGQVDECTHNLLTLHHDTLYYQTNLGAVASLATRDGRLNWLTAYPRAKPRENVNLNDKPAHYYRDLNPAVYHQGKLFLAPADCRSIFALEAATGQLLWQSEHPEDIVHLLGVGAGNLVASGDKLWMFDVDTGKPVRPPEDAVQGAFGRGLLAGDRIYWPTHEQIHVFDQRTGLRARQPIELKNARQASGGNLIVAEGYLVIASAEALYAFPLSDGSALSETEGAETAKTEKPMN